jgi:hypothetical protein
MPSLPGFALPRRPTAETIAARVYRIRRNYFRRLIVSLRVSRRSAPAANVISTVIRNDRTAMANAETITPQEPTFLRLSAGFIYFYFGFLKFFPDLSPAELVSGQTLMRLSLNWLDAHTVLWWLAVVECTIGLSFLFNVFLRWVFFLFLVHQAGTFLPLFLLPEITFKFVPFAPTLEGQYILKNLVSVAAGWTVMLPAVQAGWACTKDRR